MVNLHDNITTIVDVTIASHNAQTAAAYHTVGQAAAARTIDKRRAYDRDFEITNPNVNLVIFAVEDSGAVHPEAHQFLRSHARLGAPDNPGRELGHSLATLSVSIHAARAKSVTTARDLLSVDALPPQPYITGILPIVPPPAWLALDVHPPPTPEPIAYQVPRIPPIIYQPSQVNITNDHQSYGVVEEIPNHSAVTPPPRQPPSSRSESSFTVVPSTRTSVNGRNNMVIQQPPRQTTAASLSRPIAALSHPPLRSYTASTVTDSSSSFQDPAVLISFQDPAVR